MTDNLLGRARQAAQSARTLLESGDPNGAVDRAHYAMFHAAHAALEHRGIEIASAKHGILVARFGEHPGEDWRSATALGTSLNRTLELRQKADYGSGDGSYANAERSLREAEAFVAAVTRLCRG
jgi:uncharacterized protein (UPF0332 family)